MIHRVYRQAFDTTLIQPFGGGRKCPPWLGTFKFTIYDAKNPLPQHLRDLHNEIVKAVELEKFECNTWFAQTYKTNTEVFEHKDPKSNLGWTYVAVFGTFEGAESTIKYEGKEPEKIQLYDGDILVLPCTNDGIQGPLHSVSPVTSGTRYAFIGNRISL